MQITIHCKSTIGLEEFVPIEGTFTIEDTDTIERNPDDVITSVRNWMDAPFAIEVKLFHSNGRAITGDTPSQGAFIAVRE